MAGIVMVRGTPIVIALAFVLAGCVQAAGKPAGSGTDQPMGPGDIDPSSPNGVVTGTVVSEEGAPVVGAQVALQGTPMQGLTDEKGFFVFKDVPPAKYVLLVGALGYESQGKAIEVVAGQATTVTMVVKAIEVQSAVYQETVHFVMWFDCAIGVPGWVSACSYPYTAVFLEARVQGVNLSQYGVPADIQKNDNRYNLSVRSNVGQMVAEMAWTPASAAATTMQLVVQCGDYEPIEDGCTDDGTAAGNYITYGQKPGPSPLKIVIDRETIAKESKRNPKYDISKHPSTWMMDYVGLPFQTQPQVALQQKLDVYNTIFYNGKGPDDFTILGDG